MLIELRLRNLAVVEDATLDLSAGLNVLSGSTGAGKSLVVEALRWLRGERIDHSLLRPGSQVASAEAMFDLNDRGDLVRALTDLGVEPPIDGLLRIRRELRANGRSRAFIGPTPTTASTLAAVSRDLVQLESQHRQLALLDPASHVRLLDDCGVAPALVAEFQAAYDEHRALLVELEAFRAEQRRVEADRELLEYQRGELDQAQIQVGEMEELRVSVARLSGGARLLESVAQAHAIVSSEDIDLGARLGEALAALRSVDAGVEELEAATEQLELARESVVDAARALETFLDADAFDPGQLDSIQARLSELEQLARKYGRDEVELIAYLEQLRARLGATELKGGMPAELAARLESAVDRLQGAARKLERARKSTARRVAGDAPRLLAELGMPDAEIEFRIEVRASKGGPIRIGSATAQPTRSGASEIRLHVRTNLGGDTGPVERVASGGELSRIGLVLRALASDRARPAVLILDEIDAGLGADLGPALAARLADMASRSQLLVISHLPAVAAAAKCHLMTRKRARAEDTVSTVVKIDGQARVDEIARMLGGANADELRLAQQLLEIHAAPEAGGASP